MHVTTTNKGPVALFYHELARLAKDNIRSVEVIDFPDLGMEAVWRIEVEDFPAFVVVDDKGNDFFAATSTPTITSIPVGPPNR